MFQAHTCGGGLSSAFQETYKWCGPCSSGAWLLPRDWGKVASLLEEAAPESGHEIMSEDEARADGHAKKREGTFYPEAVSEVW